MIKFPFNERKAAQSAAYLLHLHGGSMNYMALIKLLYLADRRALIERGLPITGDYLVSMPHGPVLSRVLDLINMGKPEPLTVWFEYVGEPRAHNVRALVSVTDKTAEELSPYELRLLRETHATYGQLDRFRLRDLTHTLPEWVDPKGSSHPIPPEDILRAASKSEEEIERVASDAAELWLLSSLESHEW